MTQEKSSGVFVGLFIGGIIGAATALMLAPKTGSELRKDLIQAYYDLEATKDKLLTHLKNRSLLDEEQSTAELLDRAQALYNEAMESSAKLLQQIKQTQSNEEATPSANENAKH